MNAHENSRIEPRFKISKRLPDVAGAGAEMQAGVVSFLLDPVNVLDIDQNDVSSWEAPREGE